MTYKGAAEEGIAAIDSSQVYNVPYIWTFNNNPYLVVNMEDSKGSGTADSGTIAGDKMIANFQAALDKCTYQKVADSADGVYVYGVGNPQVCSG